MVEIYIRRKVFKWHKDNYRYFSWRDTRDSYKIIIAEFMLHRTKAGQVEPVYKDFIKKYPDIDSLAVADPIEVNKVTEKLGLHWRGQHFTDAAIFIKDNFKGRIPDSRRELLSIPGVGEYVAGAILTIVFNKKEWVVDSNIARFLDRFYGLSLSGEIRRKREVIEASKRLYQTTRSEKLTFALLDFSSLVCKPIKPVCNACIIKIKCNYWKQYHHHTSKMRSNERSTIYTLKGSERAHNGLKEKLKQRLDKDTVPIWKIESKTSTYRAKKPIAITIFKDNSLFFAENENLDVFGYGETQGKAILDLKLHILHFYKYYRKLNKDDVVGHALRMKEIYKDLLIRE